MSYGLRYRDHYTRAAIYIDKILKGDQPTDMPVEQPSQFDFVINRVTARSLGIEIPDSVLARATPSQTNALKQRRLSGHCGSSWPCGLGRLGRE
jgi:ABC-type uncharacterized transport system substrate-binding protein